MTLKDIIYSDLVEDTFEQSEYWKLVANDDELLARFQITYNDAISVSTYYEGVYEGLMLAKEVWTIRND